MLIIRQREECVRPYSSMIRLPWRPLIVVGVLCVASTSSTCSGAAAVQNEEILLDTFNINPGDSLVGNQGSKYTDVQYLKELGYTARSTSVEQSPVFCVDYRAAGRVPKDGIFQDHETLSWTTAYCESMQEFIDETHSAGLDMYFWTDMIVFPEKLLKLYPEVVRPNSTSTILWNPYTLYLVETMIDEWMQRFPGTDGIAVRTGETYVLDTPFHRGSSPVAGVGDTAAKERIWTQFIELLVDLVCVKYGRKLIFRTWDSIGATTYYHNITSRIEPHKNLYFSVKHTTGDYFRQMSFNQLLNIGNHAQIIEVQIQREYEGKGAYPLYLFEHVVLNDNSIDSNHSLSQLFPNGRNENSTIKGLWTWSRGGGWYGPYIHGSEFWIDLNLHLFLSWWKQNCTTTFHTVELLFQNVCSNLLLPANFERKNIVDSLDLDKGCYRLRQISHLADEAMVHGRYCLEAGPGEYSGCWDWTRDDKLGGYNQLSYHFDFLRGNETRVQASLSYKRRSIELWDEALTVFDEDVAPSLRQWNYRLYRQIRSSFLYAQSYFCVIESGWRAMIYGIVKSNRTYWEQVQLHSAIHNYDACWQKYHALSIGRPEFPSVYRGIYWNFRLQEAEPGMDATIAKLRLQL